MKENSITVLALPPHTSHRMQPLDHGIFSSFKQAWQQQIKVLTRNTAGRKLDKKDFFRVFTPVWEKSITVGNAQGAFTGSGLFPLNMNAIPDHAFDPSSTTERELLQENGQNVTEGEVSDSQFSAGNPNAVTDIIIDWSTCTGSTTVKYPLSGNDVTVQWCNIADTSAVPLELTVSDVVDQSTSSVCSGHVCSPT